MLERAKAARSEARARMDRAPAGSERWREAEEDLAFWQGKVANLEALARLRR